MLLHHLTSFNIMILCVLHQAPEQLIARDGGTVRQTRSMDIFSLGCVLHFVITGKLDSLFYPSLFPIPKALTLTPRHSPHAH